MNICEKNRREKEKRERKERKKREEKGDQLSSFFLLQVYRIVIINDYLNPVT